MDIWAIVFEALLDLLERLLDEKTVDAARTCILGDSSRSRRKLVRQIRRNVGLKQFRANRAAIVAQVAALDEDALDDALATAS